jgi:23S rRNA pseudouridine1911/1915/1917 synthase
MAEPRTLSVTVPEAAAGARLDAYLGSVPEIGSRSAAERLLRAGQVQVNGARARKSLVLAGGESVQALLDDPRPAPVAADVEFAIVHQDDDLLVVDKPPGLVVHPAPAVREPTLAEGLAGLAGGGPPERPGIVHRLDRNTSGLMVVARHEQARRRLSNQIRRRAMKREYLALVEGRPRSRSGTIDAPIGRDPRRRGKMVVEGADAREARTHFEVVEILPKDTLVAARLETGRTHQIRAHFAAIGHPVAGDPQYGNEGRHGLTRQFLHSHRLEFDHPMTGEPRSFSSALPQDLETALHKARGPASP